MYDNKHQEPLRASGISASEKGCTRFILSTALLMRCSNDTVWLHSFLIYISTLAVRLEELEVMASLKPIKQAVAELQWHLLLR
eukprot:IDg6101t1